MPAPKGNKYAKGNKGGGRKSRYKKEYAELAYNFCLLGATDQDLAIFFETSEKTINNWKKRHKDFYSALKEGKDAADARVVKSLFQRATGYACPDTKAQWVESDFIDEDGEWRKVGRWEYAQLTKHYPPDSTALIFWLKNRQKDKWRDKQPEATGGDVADILSKLADKLPGA